MLLSKLNPKGIEMKKVLIATAVVSMLTACGTSGTNYSSQYSNQNAVQSAQMSTAISQAPEWMSKLPKAPGYVFENGTATSSDFGFADIKAKTIAYSKICTSAGGKVRSQVKMYKADNGDVGTEQSEMAIRSMCADVDISGVETVEMKHVADGNRIRTYVLVALPTTGRMNKDIKQSAKEAFKELDEITGNKSVGNNEPVIVTPVVPQKSEEVTVKRPDGTTSTLNLMPVENAEYKARREEALKKPGAVIGQVSVAN
jgi:aspartate 1-decarboxylase